jgi:hypothetical protein
MNSFNNLPKVADIETDTLALSTLNSSSSTILSSFSMNSFNNLPKVTDTETSTLAL